MSMEQLSNEKRLKQALVSTISYFDFFDYPLTTQECWQYLISLTAASLDETVQCLEKDIEGIERTGAFFHRAGRSEITKTRLSRYLIAERKYRAALRFAQLAGLIPGIRMISVCNTLAFSAARDESDIDFFIVTRSGSLWFARALCGVLALLCGARPTDYNRKDTYCLSFFASETMLDLSQVALEPNRAIDDIYLAQWVSMCVPLFDDGSAYDEFWKANEWARAVVPHRSPYRTNDMRSIRYGFAARTLKALLKYAYHPFRHSFERLCRMVQLRTFPHSLRSAAAHHSTHVIISDQILKFHTNDQRVVLRERWRALL